MGWVFGPVCRGVLQLPRLAQHHLCQGEFVLQDLSFSSNVVEFFAKCPAFRLLSCQPVLEGGEVDGFFLGHMGSVSEGDNARREA